MTRNSYVFRKVRSALYISVWLLVAVPPLYSGWDFYTTPVAERPYRDDYDWFKSSGTLGHGVGIAGSLMIIIGVATYSLRKRLNRLHRLGRLRNWLSFHIFLCTLGPFLVILHTTFRFSGLVAISFWSMVIVVASGVFGRYMYVRIPKTAEGQFLNIQQLFDRRSEIAATLFNKMGISDAELDQLGYRVHNQVDTGSGTALLSAVRYDVKRWGWKSKWKQLADQNNLSDTQTAEGQRLVQRWIRLNQQITVYQPFQKLFTYWHVLHIPLAGVMFLILLVHVVVAVLFGYIWIF